MPEEIRGKIVYILRGPSDWTTGDHDGILYGVYATKLDAQIALESAGKQDVDEDDDDTFAWVDSRVIS